MSNVVTKKELDTALQKQTDEIVGVLHSFMQQVDDRFNKIESDISKLQSDMDNVLNRLDSIEKI